MDVGKHVRCVGADARSRALGQLFGLVELRHFVVGDAHAEPEHRAQQRVQVGPVRQTGGGGDQRMVMREPLAAENGEHAEGEQMVGAQFLVLLAAAVEVESHAVHGGGLIDAPGVFDVAGGGERDAAHQRQARVGSDHVLGEPAVERPQRVGPAPEPELDPAGPFGNFADERVVAGVGRMAQGVQHVAAAGQRPGDAGVHAPEPVRIAAKQPGGAVFADQRMQAYGRALAAGRLQQPAQRVHGRKAQPGLGAPRGLVHESGLDPVEQRDVENEIPVLLRQAAPQPGLDPGRGRVAGAEIVDGDARLEGVAVQAQRDRPSRGIRRYGGKLCAGQALGTTGLRGGSVRGRVTRVEKPPDLFGGESQILGGQRLAPPLKGKHRDVKALGALAERQGEVKIPRRALQHCVENVDRIGAGEPIEFVQRQHARAGVAADGAQEQVDAVVCGRIGRGIRGRLGAGRAPVTIGVEHADAGLLEREPQVGRHRHGIVVLVHGEPGDRDALLAQFMAAAREQRGLAETARGVQNGEAAACRAATGLERGAFNVTQHFIGQLDLVGEQPGSVGGRRGIPQAVPGFPPGPCRAFVIHVVVSRSVRVRGNSTMYRACVARTIKDIRCVPVPSTSLSMKDPDEQLLLK